MKTALAQLHLCPPALLWAVILGAACATPPPALPAALDPASTEAEEEETASAQLTPLVVPGPPEPSEPTGNSPHAGHDMGTTKPADPHAGHDMGATKPAPTASDPHAGHDMGAKKPVPADPHAGHDMGATKPADPHAGHDMGGATSLRGVVTRVAGPSLTVTVENGESVIILTDTQTGFERGEQKATLKSIKPGARVVIDATATGGKYLAKRVKLSATSAPVKGADAGTPVPDAQAQEFVCPMHPEVRSATQGKCPRCGMKLQPVPADKKPARAEEFICPMHPEVRSATQGKCPKCGMKLQPAPADKKPPAAQEFVCPMHPEVRSATQDRCPKCGMKLQPAGGAK